MTDDPAAGDPVTAYLSMLEHERRLSDHTLRGYTHELDELKKLANGRALESLTATDMRGAVARAHGGGLSARSIAHRLSAWRAFYRWLAEQVEMQANPVATVRAPKRAKSLPKALSVDDANALMEAPQADTPEALRDHAILELFYSSGLRLAELVGLDVHFVQSEGYSSAGWLDLASTEVNVLGKGNRRRSVPVGSKAITALRAWIEVRGQFVKDDPHALFLSARGNRMSPNVVRDRAGETAWRCWPACRRTCIRTCCGIRSPRTCCNPVATCGRCWKCAATPVSQPRRFTRRSISSIWHASMTRRIHAQKNAIEQAWQ